VKTLIDAAFSLLSPLTALHNLDSWIAGMRKPLVPRTGEGLE
jgi:hypothetical protein